MVGQQSWRMVRLAGGLAFCALGIILFSYFFQVAERANAIGAVAGIVWITGILFVISFANSKGRDLAIRREADEILKVVNPNPLGLVSITPESTDFDYRGVIDQSRELVIVLNDGRTWLSTHRARLRERFSDGRRKTTIFLIHPESSFIPVLARKGSTDSDSVCIKIKESLQLLRDIHEGDHELEVLGHFLYNTHSVVLGDDRVAVTPYYLSRGSRTVPVYLYADNGGPCYFREIRDDVERLRMDSQALPLLTSTDSGDFRRRALLRLHH